MDLRKLCERALSDQAGLSTQVTAFHKLYGLPIVPSHKAKLDLSHMTRERLAMRFNLIAEEFMELLEAMDIKANIQYFYLDEWNKYVQAVDLRDAIENTEEWDMVEVADACGDLKYVIQGFELEVGIPSNAVMQEIHASNMTKLGEDGKPIYRDDGKVLKGPHYQKADIRKQLCAYGVKP